MNNCSDCDQLNINNTLLNESIWTLPVTVTSSALTATTYVIIFCVAVIFNPLIMVFIIRAKGLYQPSFIFLFCLALVDFLEALLSIPFYIATHIKHGWKFGDTDHDRQAVCDMVGLFLSVFLGVSVYLLAMISFDRFFYIVCSFNYKRYMKPWVAWLIVLSLCAVPVIISSLPLFGFSYFDFNQDFGACLFRWRGETAYVIVYSAFAFFPFVLIFIFTVITCCYLRRFISGKLNNRAKFVMRRQDSKVEERAKQNTLTRLFALLLVTQIICFMPAFLTAFIGARFGYYVIPSQLFLIDFILLLANAAINPLIQSLVWKKLRKKLCFCRKSKCCQRYHHYQVPESSSSSSPGTHATGLSYSMEITESNTDAKPELYHSVDVLVDVRCTDGSHSVKYVTQTCV